MAKINYICGIDIGTHTTRVVVLGYAKGNTTPEIIATGNSESHGVRLGYIHNVDYVAGSIKRAVEQAEKALNTKIHKAYVSIGGIHLGSAIASGEAVISRADQEITQLDIQKALAHSEENLDCTNKKIIHVIPQEFKLDGKEIHGRPEGMKGVKLEVKTLFVTCLKQNLEDLVTAMTLAGIDIIDIIASPIASSAVLLSNKQKAAGCLLLDVGAETVSMAVLENNLLMSIQVFQIGSMDITKDVALGFRIPLEEAENVKIGTITGGDYPKKKVDEIIEARLTDIFELVNNQLKRLRRNGLLPAGIILSGGGAHINRIEEIAKKELKLPSRIGPTDTTLNTMFKIRDASWYTALGLALSAGDESIYGGIQQHTSDNIKQVKGFFKTMLSQLLP